jgi:hypothetical protein
LFDEPAPVFGRFRVTAALGDGRFGLVHLGVDPETDQVVVVRTFTGPFTDAQQEKLVQALQRLCERPLDHESVATPLACGVENGAPYLVHSYLPGTSVDEFLRAHGPRPLSDVTLRVTHLAGALDFAAAVDVYHGALSPRDIIFASQSTGVAGFGLVQAMHEAGLDVKPPTRADDIYALAAMTFELLVGYRYTGGSVRDALAPLRGVSGVDFEALVTALEPTLSAADSTLWPETALAFASSLHAAQGQGDVPPTTASRPSAAEIGRLSFGLDDPQTAPAVLPAALAEPAPEHHADRGAAMTFETQLQAAVDETPYGFGAPAPAEEPGPALAAEPGRVPAEESPAPVTQRTSESVAFVPEPTYPDPSHADLLSTPEAVYSQEPSYTPEPAYVPEPAYTEEHELHRAPLHEQRSGYDAAAESFALHMDHDRPASDPPMLSAAREDDRSGLRVFAFAAVAALVVILAIVFYLMRGTTIAPSDVATTVDDVLQTERVDEPTPVPPSGSAPSSQPDTAVAPPVAPVVQEPPSQTAVVPPRAAETRGASPTSPSEPGAAGRAGSAPPVPREPVAGQPASPSPASASAAREGTPGGASSSRTAPRSAPAVPAAAAEAPVVTGRVLVRSTPSGARVLVNGTPRGETPLAIRDLEFGTHTITVEAPGYPRWQRTVTLTAERPAQSFEVALDNPGAASGTAPAGTPPASAAPGGRAPAGTATAGLQIDSRPAGAQVWVDGTLAGVTPLLLLNVSVGTHSVRIELPGFRPWTTSVSVATGERTRVAASLEQ